MGAAAALAVAFAAALGAAGAAALFAGTVFAFGHYKIGHLSQLNLLSTQWIPLCFLFLRRILRSEIAGQKTGAALMRPPFTART